MIVKTKKYQLELNTYLKLAMLNIAKEWWWVWPIPVAIILLGAVFSSYFWWFFGTALTLTILYVAFWLVQFAAVTQVEQGKILFQKLSYEIDSRQIMVKLNPKEGMKLNWDQFKSVKRGKSDFLFIMSKVQMIHLPDSVFRSEHDIRFLESILRRKNFLPAAEEPKVETEKK